MAKEDDGDLEPFPLWRKRCWTWSAGPPGKIFPPRCYGEMRVSGTAQGSPRQFDPNRGSIGISAELGHRFGTSGPSLATSRFRESRTPESVSTRSMAAGHPAGVRHSPSQRFERDATGDSHASRAIVRGDSDSAVGQSHAMRRIVERNVIRSNTLGGRDADRNDRGDIETVWLGTTPVEPPGQSTRRVPDSGRRSMPETRKSA